MHVDAFLFLQRSDIAHSLETRCDLTGKPLMFIDPGLIEEALKAGLDPTHFSYRPLTVGRHFHAQLTQEAFTRASTIDQALTRERQRLFGDGVFQGWDHGPLRLFFTRALVAKYLGEICDRGFDETAIGLFRPTRPQQFYFDSFLSTDLFIGGSARWRVVDQYDKVLNWLPEHASRCFDFGRVATMAVSGQAQAVTHIPTCYQHHRLYVAEIQRAFGRTIDLPSAFWDIPLNRDGSMSAAITDIPRDHVSERAHAYRDVARRVFIEQLAPLVPNRHALLIQADSLAAGSFQQAINYEGLQQALRGTRPHFILTDHDTGSVGPLFSVAAQLEAPITVLPHSSYPVFALPHALNTLAVERDGFHTPVRTVCGEKVPMRPLRIDPQAVPIPRQRIRTVCLLFNTLFGQGLAYIDFAGMARFYRGLRDLCKQHDARLLVRLKPSASAVVMAASAFELDETSLKAVLALPIGEVAEQSDLCISYGEPTTAGIEFLARGTYLMHASEQLWPADYWMSPAYIGDASVPSTTGPQALLDIASLMDRPESFAQRAQAQRERYAGRLTAQDADIFKNR